MLIIGVMRLLMLGWMCMLVLIMVLALRMLLVLLLLLLVLVLLITFVIHVGQNAGHVLCDQEQKTSRPDKH
jgi:hypothetical protein